MSWRLFRWTWQLDGPLFVGSSPAGALNRCRLYVPARAVWGAVTAELARQEQSGGPAEPKHYEDVGSDLKRDYRFTYLYPAEQVRGKWQAWLPKYESGRGLHWQREDETSSTAALADRGFRRRILYTRPGTAIDPGSDTAADGSLRETECLQACWRDEAGCDAGPVALVGYVVVRHSDGPADDGMSRLATVRSLFVGGDTRYGLGRLNLVSCEASNPANRMFGRDVELDGEWPVVRSAIVLGHTVAAEHMSGALEALSGWNLGEQTALDADGTPLCTPGSCVDHCLRTTRFSIDSCGIWHLEGRADLQPQPE